MATIDEITLAIAAVVADASHVSIEELLGPDASRPADPYSTVAASELWAPVKLRLLSGVSDNPDVSYEERLILANSLVSAADGAAEKLVGSVVKKPGLDPLGRQHLDSTPPDFFNVLNADIKSHVLIDVPWCDASMEEVGGTPALSIRTTLESRRPVQEFERMINPLQWTTCPLENSFFRSMVPVAPPPRVNLSPPDNGWKQTITETVDFSFGLQLFECVTDLAFLYYSPPPPPDITMSIGATYSLERSRDGKILVDRGYLLGEQGSDGIARVQTLKQVWFTDGNAPVPTVCPAWNLMTLALMYACR